MLHLPRYIVCINKLWGNWGYFEKNKTNRKGLVGHCDYQMHIMLENQKQLK